MNKKYAVLSLSGGLDSSTLLLHLLAQGFQVQCLSFDYGQKHKVELEKAKELIKYINSEFDKMELLLLSTPPKIKHQIIKLDGLSQLLNSSLVEGGSEVPEGHYASENMKETVVPNRNKIFSSIVQSVALSIAQKHKTECVMALGVHSGDHAIYPDCTEQFRQADLNAFKVGNWDSELVDFYAPYMEGNKFTILEDGLKCCEQLGLDFDEVYKRTNTSYKPIPIPIYHSDPAFSNMVVGQKWYSDYKSASSVERIEAFLKLGRKDPVPYAEILPNGEPLPRTWEEVVVHVQAVLNENKQK